MRRQLPVAGQLQHVVSAPDQMQASGQQGPTSENTSLSIEADHLQRLPHPESVHRPTPEQQPFSTGQRSQPFPVVSKTAGDEDRS